MTVGRLPRRRTGVLALAFVSVVTLVSVNGAAVAATTPPSAAPSPTSSAGTAERASFGIQPAPQAGSTPRGIFAISATAGASVQDAVVVTNNGTIPLRLRVTAEDAVPTDQGAFGFTTDADPKTGVGSWITIDPRGRVVDIPPRTDRGPSSVKVGFVLRIPAEASPGDHGGGILAVLTSASASTPGNPGVTLQQRVATRVIVRVAGDVRAELSVSDLKADFQGTASPLGRGDVALSWTLRNTGNVVLGARSKLRVSGLLGAGVDSPGANQGVLLPGAVVRQSATIANVLPVGPMTADVVVEPLAVQGSAEAVMPTSASVGFFAWPITVLAYLGVLVLLLVLVIVMRRRRQRRRARQRRAEPTTGRHSRGSSSTAGTPEPVRLPEVSSGAARGRHKVS